MNESFWFELNKLKSKMSDDLKTADISTNIKFPIPNTGNGAAVDYRLVWTFWNFIYFAF